jgi:peptidyl-prolyl cis-trans isomerase D
MLKALRKKGVAKKIFITLAIVIVPAFVLWGSASLMRSQKYSYAGKIFGRKVSFDEFQESLRATQTQALLQYGENFYKIQRFLNLENEAWGRLILLQEARKRRIHVSDQEVVESISQMPFFQRDGRFDEKTYQSILDYVFKTPARFFEEQDRQQLILSKLFRQITDRISLNDKELLAAYKRENEKAKVSYLLIAPQDFEKMVSLGNTEAQDYFNAHRQEFKQPPAVDLQYLEFSYPKDAKEETKKPIQERAMTAYTQLQEGEALEKVAQQENITIKETGFFSLENTPPPGVPLEVIQTVSLLKEHQFSNPVLAPSGCFIVRIKDRKDAYLPDFPEVKSQAEKIITQQKSRELALEKAKQFRNQINLKVKDLNGWAADFGLKVAQTPLFKLGEYLPNIGPSGEFHNAAFGLKEKDKVSEVITSTQGFYILKLDEFTPIDEQKFKNEKEKFQVGLLEQKRKDFFNDFFENLKKKANLQDNVSKMKVGW